MFHTTRSVWSQIATAIDAFLDKRNGMSAIMAIEDADDRLEMHRTDRFIVSQQYLKHMASYRIKGREEWRRLQAALPSTDDTTDPGQTTQ